MKHTSWLNCKYIDIRLIDGTSLILYKKENYEIFTGPDGLLIKGKRYDHFLFSVNIARIDFKK